MIVLESTGRINAGYIEGTEPIIALGPGIVYALTIAPVGTSFDGCGRRLVQVQDGKIVTAWVMDIAGIKTLLDVWEGQRVRYRFEREAVK